MDRTGQELHYIRAMRFLDKLHSLVEDGKYNKEEEKEFFIRLAKLCRENPMTMFDLNNFLLTCSIGVFGLNKESIENSSRNNNYGFDIKYLDPRFAVIRTAYNQFKKENILSTGLEDWLAVTSVSPHIAPNNNFLFNVRNALMHSEYDFDMQDRQPHMSMFLNIHNSNYTGFEGKIFLSNYTEFVKQYYSNDAFFGLQTDFYFMDAEHGRIKFNKNDLFNQLSRLHLYKLQYQNDSKLKNMIEKKLIDERSFQKYMNKNPDRKEEIIFDDNKKKQVELIINHYYGDKFYDMKFDDQMRIILPIYKYLVDPKMVMSNWIMHFYNMTAASVHLGYADEDFRSVFAAEPTIAILKSYMVMYRLQNPSFKEVDYNLIDDIKYTFLEDDQDVYEKHKNTCLRINPHMSQSEIDKRYFSEIYRNALAHGKIKVDVVSEDGEVKQKIIFEDIYKGKRRVISIELKELNKYIDSKAFSDSEAIDKSKVQGNKR